MMKRSPCAERWHWLQVVTGRGLSCAGAFALLAMAIPRVMVIEKVFLVIPALGATVSPS